MQNQKVCLLREKILKPPKNLATKLSPYLFDITWAKKKEKKKEKN